MKHIFRYILIAFLPVIAYAQPAANYYTSAALDGKNGRTLELALTAIIHPHTKIGYDNLWNKYEITDVVPQTLLKDPNRTDQVYDMYAWINRLPKYYSDHDHSQQGGINREHCVPNSWWGHEAGNSIAYTDLHHLVPSDGAANNAKSNFPLGEYAEGMTLGWPTSLSTNAQGIVYVYPDDANNPIHSASHRWDIPTEMRTNYGGATAVFEPADEYKGDFARMYLYVVCAYEGTITWQTTYMFTSDASNHTTILPWAKNLLLKWHRQDPVSDKELARNNAVCNIQGNRNPFIDYPELVEYIWGDLNEESFSLESAILAYSPTYPSSSSTVGYTAEDPYIVTFYNEGAELATVNCFEYEEIPFPSNPTSIDPNYTFVGWSENVVSPTNTCPTLFNRSSMSNSDKAFHAVYELTTITNTWNEISAAPEDGTYAILCDDYFMKASISNNCFENGTATPDINETTKTLSTAPEEDCIWEITKDQLDGMYRIQHEGNYAGGTPMYKSRAEFLTDPSYIYSKWSIGLNISNKIRCTNYGRSQSSTSTFQYLRNNGESGWGFSNNNESTVRLFKKNSTITDTFTTTTVPPTQVTIGTAGWTTYSAAYNFTVDQPAYKAVLDENAMTITILPINPNGEIIPADAGILIGGRGLGEQTATITPTTATATADMSNNSLLSTGINTYTVQATDNIYCLTKNSNEFNHVISGVTIPLHKAYFQLTTTSQAPLRVVLPEDVATGLEQQILSPTKGEYRKVLIDGKFVLIREGKMFDINGMIIK